MVGINETWGHSLSVASPFFFNNCSPSFPSEQVFILFQFILYLLAHYKINDYCINKTFIYINVYTLYLYYILCMKHV